MAENKVDWTNFSFAQRFFKLEPGGNVSHSVRPLTGGTLPPSVTPATLAADLANENKPIGRLRTIVEEELFTNEDRQMLGLSGNARIHEIALAIVKGAGRPRT